MPIHGLKMSHVQWLETSRHATEAEQMSSRVTGQRRKTADVVWCSCFLCRFTPKTFPPVADNIFQSFIDAHRKGDLSGLSYLATEGLYASLKADVTFAGRRRKGSGPMTRAAFRLVRMTEPTCILQFRHAVEDGSNNKSGWGQITCQFVSER